MDKNYVASIIVCNYNYVFDSMGLTFDEADNLAKEIANRFFKHMERIYYPKEYHYNSSHYNLVQHYCADISFDKVWSEMKGEA